MAASPMLCRAGAAWSFRPPVCSRDFPNVIIAEAIFAAVRAAGRREISMLHQACRTSYIGRRGRSRKMA